MLHIVPLMAIIRRRRSHIDSANHLTCCLNGPNATGHSVMPVGPGQLSPLVTVKVYVTCSIQGSFSCWFQVKHNDLCERLSYQLLYSFIQNKLGKVRRNLFHFEAAASVHHVLELGQTETEMVVCLTGNIHVSQGEVHPYNGEAWRHRRRRG